MTRQLHAIIIVIFSVCCLSACTEQPQVEKGALHTFHDYVELAKTNNNFDIEMGFYSNNKQRAIKQSLAIDKRNNSNIEQQYMSVNQKLANCNNMKLSKLNQDNEKAVLIFDVVSTCDNSEQQTQMIVMVREGKSWKIEENKLYNNT